MFKQLFLAITILLIPALVLANDNIKKLQEIAVTITTNHGQGSGVIKTRKSGNDNISLVWTAAHVVSSLRHTREVIDGKTGTKREIVEFDDCSIVQTINEEGRLVANYSLLAEIIKYSEQEDLALLRVRKKNFSTASVKFYLDKNPPDLGSDVWNVGSALGLEGSNTVSKGVVSQHGRIFEKRVYDQVSCPGFPGCSGSGVYLNDNRMIGMLTRGSGETWILIVPARRIIAWAKQAHVEWAYDDNVPFPSEEDLKKVVIEDNGVVFPASPQPTAAPKISKKLLLESKSLDFDEFFLNGIPQ
jgi:Trypsin-like peptidase domain